MNNLSILVHFFVVIFTMVLISSTSGHASSYSFPDEIDPSSKYLIFLHGRLVENKGVGASHPKYGAYEYFKILKSFEDMGVSVISEVRSADTNRKKYAKKIAGQINKLTSSGVLSKNISVVGFSKGGAIALFTAAFAKDPDINYVIMAGCGKTGNYLKVYKSFLKNAASKLQGRILSLYDRKDEITGSCSKALALASQGQASKEIQLDTGKGHGTFYNANQEWLIHISNWLSESH